jgi:hypothetical protein
MSPPPGVRLRPEQLVAGAYIDLLQAASAAR